MSPLQYQKQIRLREARKLMLLRSLDAASVARRVAARARRSSAASIAACSAPRPAGCGAHALKAVPGRTGKRSACSGPRNPGDTNKMEAWP